MTLFLSNQQPLILSKQLGAGGEGTVYALPNQPNVVAKIYHQAPTVRKQAKLTAMVLGCDFELEKIALWPKALVYDEHQQVVGFLMPRLPASSLAIHHLYNPSQRKKDFAQADYAFLIHAARNLAAAFAALHSHGHCIGDVNQGNLVVATDATVKLIDCDSFQIKTEQSVFVCEVGVAHFTPPELHGQSFGDIQTTASHDNFGLAILIFHLLMMGRHPFAGVYLGEGEMTIEKAITEFRYAYSQQNIHTRMKPPPKAPSIDWLPQDIKQLFEEAFDADVEKRPSAANWLQALESFKKELKLCSVMQAHKYYKNLSQCPWCEFANKYRVEFFLVKTQQTAHKLSAIDIDDIEQQIQQLSVSDSEELPSHISTMPSLTAKPLSFPWSNWILLVSSFLWCLVSFMPITSWIVTIFASLIGGGIFCVIFNFMVSDILGLIEYYIGIKWPIRLWLKNSDTANRKARYLNKLQEKQQIQQTLHGLITENNLLAKQALLLCSEYRQIDRSTISAQDLSNIERISTDLPLILSQLSSQQEALEKWRNVGHELAQAEIDYSLAVGYDVRATNVIRKKFTLSPMAKAMIAVLIFILVVFAARCSTV